MDATNFKESFLSSVHNRKMINIEYSAEFLIPNIYRYQDLPETVFSISDFLHLLGGGNIHADSPFAFHFSPMNAHFCSIQTVESDELLPVPEPNTLSVIINCFFSTVISLLSCKVLFFHGILNYSLLTETIFLYFLT